jgi:hypothetical protein
VGVGLSNKAFKEKDFLCGPEDRPSRSKRVLRSCNGLETVA